MAADRQRSKRGRGEQRLIIVANRLPVRKVKRGRSTTWETSPGGLVTALEPVLKERGGAWVGWDGTTARKATPAFVHEGIRIRPVPLSKDEYEQFYSGFSNRTLWPLYHDVLREPLFHRHWWWPYYRVNERFAEATAEIATDRDMVWVQDYQLQLAPGMIRQRRPKTRIGFFLHTPFPPEELFAKMPWRQRVLEGLLGSDLIGFQDRLSVQNFARAARRFTGATGDASKLKFEGRTIAIDAFPISIDVKQFQARARNPSVVAAAERFRASWDYRRIILGVDRLDYTKGIDMRMRAFEDLLARGAYTAEDVLLIQIAVPTRQSVDDYAELRENVERYVGRINGQHAMTQHIAVHYVYRSLPPDELMAAYLAADVMMVTPFRDGMNLVAKEYCAVRHENTGVLVLSEFAGAAHELNKALLVNPYDIDGMAAALEQALEMDEAERTRRMGALRRVVESHDVHDWSDSFIARLGGLSSGSRG